MKKMIKSFIAGIATLSAVAGIALAAPAEGEADTLYTGAAEMTKELQVPTGIVIPDVTFNFTVTPLGVEDDTNPTGATVDSGRAGECPTWIIPSLNFGPSDPLIQNVDIWALIDNSTVVFPHAGVYYYQVVEAATTGTDVSKIANSQAEYTLRVYVENDGSGGLTVAGITVYQVTKDDGTPGGTKVDPTPGVTGDGGSNFRFVNRYWEVTTLQVKKVVTGDYADLKKDFDFTIVVTLPSTTPIGHTVSYTTTSTSTPSSGSFNYSGSTETITVKLRDGETIDFTNLPAGSTYTVTEAAAPSYTPEADFTGGDGTTGSDTSGTAGANFEVEIGGSKDLLVTTGTGSNSTTVTNDYRTPNITGVIMDNLPFILMVVVAGAGITFLTVSKRRRNAR